MEFQFKPTSCDDPALDAETAELMRQRLEAGSRKVMPGMWKVTDKLNAYASKGPDREKRLTRCRVYGVLLIALGIFALVPGLMEPRTPSLIWAGGWAIFAGCFEFYLVKGKKPLRPPASCRKEAARLLANYREVYREQSKVRVDEAGISVTAGEIQNTVPYGEITGVFETERLWLLVYSGEKALLLQKKDLVSGEPEKFRPYLQGKIIN